MSSHDPIAYTYEADTHCPDCARARFGRDARGHIAGEGAEDSEGESPGAIAPWDEWHACEGPRGASVNAVLVCGTCRKEIERCAACEAAPPCSHMLPEACPECDPEALA